MIKVISIHHLNSYLYFHMNPSNSWDTSAWHKVLNYTVTAVLMIILVGFGFKGIQSPVTKRETKVYTVWFTSIFASRRNLIRLETQGLTWQHIKCCFIKRQKNTRQFHCQAKHTCGGDWWLHTPTYTHMHTLS